MLITTNARLFMHHSILSTSITIIILRVLTCIFKEKMNHKNARYERCSYYLFQTNFTVNIRYF